MVSNNLIIWWLTWSLPADRAQISCRKHHRQSHRARLLQSEISLCSGAAPLRTPDHPLIYWGRLASRWTQQLIELLLPSCYLSPSSSIFLAIPVAVCWDGLQALPSGCGYSPRSSQALKYDIKLKKMRHLLCWFTTFAVTSFHRICPSLNTLILLLAPTGGLGHSLVYPAICFKNSWCYDLSP
jgi:hypothetical protein